MLKVIAIAPCPGEMSNIFDRDNFLIFNSRRSVTIYWWYKRTCQKITKIDGYQIGATFHDTQLQQKS